MPEVLQYYSACLHLLAPSHLRTYASLHLLSPSHLRTDAYHHLLAPSTLGRTHVFISLLHPIIGRTHIFISLLPQPYCHQTYINSCETRTGSAFYLSFLSVRAFKTRHSRRGCFYVSSLNGASDPCARQIVIRNL